jgi:hypothetical protein
LICDIWVFYDVLILVCGYKHCALLLMILFGIVFLGLIFLGVFWFFYGINAKRVFKVEFFFLAA